MPADGTDSRRKSQYRHWKQPQKTVARYKAAGLLDNGRNQ